MDTFADRFLNRKNAQEMIQANSAADAAQIEQLQRQVVEYDTLLQDMRKVNLKAAENMDKMQKALQEGLEKLEAVKVDKKDTQAQQEALLSEIKKQLEEFARKDDNAQSEQEILLSEIKKQLEESIKRSDDFLHMDNVKVYRNVQAAVTEELDKQTDVLAQKQKEAAKSQKPALALSVIIMLMVLVDIIINLFNIVIKL